MPAKAKSPMSSPKPGAAPCVVVYFEPSTGKLITCSDKTGYLSQNGQAFASGDEKTIGDINKEVAVFLAKPDDQIHQVRNLFFVADTFANVRANFDASMVQDADQIPQSDEPEYEEEVEYQEEPAVAAGAMKKMPQNNTSVQKGIISMIINFSVLNASVGWENVRTGWKGYMKLANVNDDNKLTFLLLALTSVNSIKKKWAGSLIKALESLGSVPTIFAGNGSTFKAFLYLGYDILMHLCSATEAAQKAYPASLHGIINNAKKVLPGGLITNPIMQVSTSNKDKAADKLAALTAARVNFMSGYSLDEQGLKYTEILLKIPVVATGKVPTDVITSYKEEDDRKPRRLNK